MIQINTLEEFKDVKDYYYCTPDGQIWTKKGKLKQMKQNETKGSAGGYFEISLRTKHNKSKTYLVHRIILTAYKPNPDPAVYTEVNHINHNKKDNRIENLEWQDRWGNTCGDPVWREKQTTAAKKNLEKAQKASKKKVMLIDEENCRVIVFQSQQQCAEYLGVNKTTVHGAIKTGGRCKGYKLKKIKN